MGKRIILALDFDAFYCGVEEKADPSLLDTPFIVYQKNCIATLSYAARNLGLKKLGLVSDAVKRFPNIRLVNGESLAPYREQGKDLWNYVKEMLPGAPIERLGLEEMWIDLTEIVDRNLEKLIDANVLFRGLSEEVEDGLDQGWQLDLTCAAFGEQVVESTSFEGEQSGEFLCEDFFFQTPAKVFPADHGTDMPSFLQTETTDADEFYLDFKLYIASQIAKEIMLKISMCKGYSCSIGVATNKTLAKMVGSINKPGGLTVLIPAAIQDFMNNCHVKKIPYFGSRSRQILRHGMKYNEEDDLKVSTVLDHFSNPDDFISLFPPTQGEKLWDLLHGIDDSQVKITSGVLTQVSIEDTYKTVHSFALAEEALKPIVESLLNQLLVDLIDPDSKSWIAYPTVIRVSGRFASSREALKNRVSHSQSLTSFAPFYKLATMETENERNQLATNLRQLIVIPMLRKLCLNNNLPPSTPYIYFQMLNVAVTGMSSTKPALSYSLAHAKRPHTIRNLDHYFMKHKS